MHIHIDLIAGLTGDTVESFKKSVDELISLHPENITVHTLSMKRASDMTKKSMFFCLEEGKPVAEMVKYAKSALENAGIYPYYMYRQGKTIGNLENVGYSKKGFEGIYNIFIMDETHTILACGASAVTKMRQPSTNRIERIFNYKYPYEYINGFSEMLKRKSAIEEFYSSFKLD
jgi:oxygen-independent coproporphyrinogen-3 oxidase